jgi:hypothetical protein
MFTKQAKALTQKTALEMPHISNPIPKVFRSGLGRAEMMGVGPISGLISAYRVNTGDVSVGGALTGSALGAGAYLATQKRMANPAARITNSLAKFAPTGTGPTSKGLLGKAGRLAVGLGKRLPGGIGAAVGIGTALGASMAAGIAGEKFGNKVAPIWRKQKPVPTLPNGFTPEQMQAMLSQYGNKSQFKP